MSNQPHKPSGSPAGSGGEFASRARTRTEVDLGTPVLKPDKIYLTYDRFECSKCTGMTALYTGVDINGFKLKPVRAQDVTEWAGYGLGPLKCECGRLTATIKNGRLHVG